MPAIPITLPKNTPSNNPSQPGAPSSNPDQNPSASPSYHDPFLDLINGWGQQNKVFKTGIVEGGNRYLAGSSPDQLLQRYQGLSSILKGGDFNQYETKNYAGQGNLDDETNYTAYKTFKSILGRDPTSGELAQILPGFQGPNGVMNGRALIASLQQQYKANPAMDPTSQQNTQKPADIQGSVNQQFQSVMGRAPTADELQHFTQAIQTGQTDAYGLGSFLKQMPEYTNAQDANFRQGLNTELQNYDTTEFNREKQGVMADYASRGMAPGNSPSLDYALTDLMGKIASNRSAYLANLSSAQYGGNKDLAVGNYQNTLNQMYSQNQGNMQNQRAYGQQLMNQGFAGADYQTQRNDYMNFINSQQRRGGSNPLFGAIGGLLGAGIGGFASKSPAGATAGYTIGSGAGNALGYLNSNPGY